MTSIPVPKIQPLVNGVNREWFKRIYPDIVQTTICYLNGDEGVPRRDLLGEDNDAPIAAEQQRVPRRQRVQFDNLMDIIPSQYFSKYNPIPTRQQFCIEMRNDYNITRGITIRAYKCVCNIRANPEGMELKQKDPVATCGRYQYISSSHNDSEQQEYVEGNIFIGTSLITRLSGLIAEKFESTLVLHHYISKSTGLQLNDGQIVIFTILKQDTAIKLGIINYDLHYKGTDKILYGIIKQNDDKWSWKLDEFLSAKQILNKYAVPLSELPKPSRKSSM